MKKNLCVFLWALFLFAFSGTTRGQVIISTVAGNGTSGYSGDGGAATIASIYAPYHIATDAAGNLYTSSGSGIIRKINSAGIISTFAGNPSAIISGDGGPATDARLLSAVGLATDAVGNVYIADESANVIRKVDPSGIITTVAGTGIIGLIGDGGPATDATLNAPSGLAVDLLGNIYIADQSNNRIRKVDALGIITTIAGNGAMGYAGDGVPATATSLSAPFGVAVDGLGNVYIPDRISSRIRKIDPAGMISTIAGTGVNGYSGDGGPATDAMLKNSLDVIADNYGNIYFSDASDNRVRKINAAGIISTVAGNGTPGYTGDGGPATAAELLGPAGLAFDRNGNLNIADNNNNVVRFLLLNNAPAFTGGAVQSLPVCQDAGAVSIDALLSVSDADAGQTETWTVLAPPLTGTLSGFPATTVSDGGTITPSGLTYTPLAGYSGPDLFTIQVADGNGGIATTIVNVTVNATPTMFNPGNQEVCNNTSTAPVNFTSADAGVTYSWANSDPGIGLAATGTGDIPAFTATNSSSAIETSTITVTPSANSCTGIPQAFTITVYPALGVDAIANQTVCNGTATAPVNFSGPVSGTTYTWTNDLSGIGLASTGTGNIASFTATNTSGATEVANIVVTPAANGCNGAQKTFAITVNPTPDVVVPADQALCNGNSTANINFSGSVAGTTYSWTNSDPGIGLASGGTGNIGAFSATNTTTGITTATITVTPSANSCTGTPRAFTITVYPTPDVNAIANQTVCNGAATAPVNFTGAVSGTTYTWVNDLSGIGLASTGTGNIASFTATNTSNVPEAANIVVTPIANGCSGALKIFSITVNPTPDVVVPADQALCNGNSTANINFSGSVTGTTYSWTNSDPSIGLASGGTGNIGAFSVTNTTTGNVTATITVIPAANTCTGTPQSLNITVYPTPSLDPAPAAMSICDSTLFFYVTSSLTPGTTFTWTRAAVTGISNPAASGADTINEVLNNNSASSVPVTVTYIDTLTANGCINVQNIIVTVNPTPGLSSSTANTAICDSSAFSYTPTSPVSGATFMWTRPYVLGIDKLGATGTGNIHDTLVNQTDSNINVIYEYVITANGCTDTEHVAVTVHPTPRLASSDSETVCSGAPFTYAPAGRVTGSTFSWSRASVTDITPVSASGTGTISETLISSNAAPLNTIYVYTVTANSCTHRQAVVLTVNPTPAVPSIDNNPPASVCGNTMNQSFGTSIPPAAGVSYVWTATNAAIFATGTNRQYAIINFTDPGTSVITLTAKGAGGCTSSTDFTVNVGTGVADAVPGVQYFNGQFVCLQNIEDGYQWGYDDATLKSTVLTGEINQNYFNNTPDFTNNHYWVMVTHNGCTQKAYYNSPLAVIPNVDMAGVKVYPNPAKEVINIAISSTLQSAAQVEVFNMLGQVVRTVVTANNTAEINVKELPAGIYILNCTRDNVKIATARFIKN